jgi:hypothetical protein
MKKNFLLVVGLVLILLVCFLFLLKKSSPNPVSPAAPSVSAGKAEREQIQSNSTNPTTTSTSENANKAPETGPHKTPATGTAQAIAPVFAPEITNLEPKTVMENVRSTIRNYGQRCGGNPVGTNPEITRALGGANPGQVNFLKADDSLRVNSEGELVDVWGTPYFFHQLSGTEMEIHSAGPDKVMWTADDLVTK